MIYYISKKKGGKRKKIRIRSETSIEKIIIIRKLKKI
jgi:hypothetical protein